MNTPGGQMVLRLVAMRLLTLIPVLFGVSLLTFFVVNVLPGGAAQQLLGAEATPEQVERLGAELGLDRSASQRYREWIERAFAGDLGKSIASGQPVASIVSKRLPVTLELVVYAMLLSVSLAVPMALLATYKPGKIIDRLGMFLSMVGVSMPNYVFALLLVLAFAVNFGIFPSIGFVPFGENRWQNIRSLTLPATAIALPLFAVYMRFLRSDLLEQLGTKGYVVTAVAKGLSPWQVLVRHVFRNSLFGLLTVVGLNFGVMLGGTVIIEQIFAIPGVGQLLLQALNARDTDVMQGVILLLALLTVGANLAVDLLYFVLDPRVAEATN